MPIGSRGIAFDRHELDAWVDGYIAVRGRPSRTKGGMETCELGPKAFNSSKDGERSVDKQYHGQRIYERLGKISQEDAEAWLRQRQAQIDASRTDKLREGDEQLFAAAAAKYLTECQQRQVRSLQTISYHVQILLPYIGSMHLRDVCNDSLEAFKDDRVADDKVKNVTVNRSL